jgi:hypothetical protein
MPAEFVPPIRFLFGGHLPRVSFADDHRQKSGGFHRFVARQVLDLELQILRQQLAEENGAIQESRGKHALTQVRRQMPRALNHPLCVISRHPHSRIDNAEPRPELLLDIH